MQVRWQKGATVSNLHQDDISRRDDPPYPRWKDEH
jgi:hypothetical protein